MTRSPLTASPRTADAPATPGATVPSGSPAWHERARAEVVRALRSDASLGLQPDDAAQRLAEHGRNELTERGGRSLARIVWEQVASVMIAILVVAGVLAAVLGRPYDTVAILAIVVLFVVLGVVQEHRAQKAIAALKQMAAPVVRVVRGGSVTERPAYELVPGDVVLLETGSVVPADVRVLESVNLRVQEAALTGESEPVDKTVEPTAGAGRALGDRTTMAYLGTAVTFGRGRGVVVATGMQTELGHIAELIQDVKHGKTLLQRRLDRLSLVLAGVAVAIAVGVVLTGLARGEEAALIVLTAVSLAVAIVPEGLPAVLTFTLALGAQRMLRRKALVRRLPAVETLGSVTVIASDKTGTLTQNRMTVTALRTVEGRVDLDDVLRADGPDARLRLPADRPDVAALLAAAALCTDTSDADDTLSAVGDPTETAMVVAAARYGLMRSAIEARHPRVAELPFDSARKRMTTVHRLDRTDAALTSLAPGYAHLAVTKGAADALLARCDSAWTSTGLVPLDEPLSARLHQEVEQLTASGRRVLAITVRGHDAPPSGGDEDVESRLTFVGLVAMVDPPRAEARDAVAICIRAGIRPMMITGDHPLTARAIAADLGISALDAPVVTGDDLDAMDADALRTAVRDVAVFARVSPEHKLRIVEALQAQGEVVAMTGDGVNDAPALKKADIGVAMGSGTDVAKEAAELVLLDDNFATVVAAVEEGRVVYDNVRRFVQFSISGNVAKVLVVAVAPLLGLPLLLAPIMILFSNLLTDGLLGLGMGVERAERETMRRAPYAPTESILSRGVGTHIAVIGPVLGAAMIAVGWFAWQATGQGTDDASQAIVATTVFTALALTQLFRALSARSFREPVWRVGLRGNPVLVTMLALALMLQLAAVYLPAVATVFGAVALPAGTLAALLGVALVLLAVMELEKALVARRTPAPSAAREGARS